MNCNHETYNLDTGTILLKCEKLAVKNNKIYIFSGIEDATKHTPVVWHHTGTW